ncbi:MAG: hypothetical protein ACP5D7_13850, partial [Limnospira sp.]
MTLIDIEIYQNFDLLNPQNNAIESDTNIKTGIEDITATDILGTPGSDTINGAGYGDFLIYGLEGNDVLLATANEQLLGGIGDDRLDGSAGTNNQLFGGKNDDILIGGRQSQLFGDLGDDQLFPGPDGENTLTGGQGSDQFWMVNYGNFAINPSAIADLEVGIDVIIVPDSTLSFERLTVTQVETDTVVSVDDLPLVTLLNIASDRITAESFVFGTEPIMNLSKGFHDDTGSFAVQQDQLDSKFSRFLSNNILKNSNSPELVVGETPD